MMGASATDLLYMLSDAVRSIRANLATTLFTSVTLGFSLAILSIFFLVFTNINTALSGWGDRTQVVVYLKDSAPPSKKLKRDVMAMDGVKSVRYISRKDALDELRAGMKGHESVLEGVDAAALPASLEIKLADAYGDPGKAGKVVRGLKAMDWAEEVQYSRQWVEQFSSFLRFLELGALFIGVFLALATVFIISNTIRLAVYARKDEIEVLSLVGASEAYIKVPFFIEGVVQGVAGGALAMIILVFARYVLASNIPQYFGFAVEMPLSAPVLLGVLVAAGVVMGVAGTLISMGKFLKV
ncbi:MAG: permease-like cell division protein FtsX [Thermodesulfobacteriota bacterium]|nr:MAG: permease-like cell division protein FtsX [Thermodesulfobacteriota bacterium]